MPKIKDIIDKLKELKILSLLNDKDPIYGEENQFAKLELETLIQSSLTSLLDSIKADIEKTKEEVRKQTGSYKYDDQYDDCINIINSHR